jgi:hypothetical protein
MEDTQRSFSSRRPATEALPPFHMPPRHASDIPSMASFSLDHDSRGFPSTITPPDSTSGNLSYPPSLSAPSVSPDRSALSRHFGPPKLTLTPGAADGISPVLSGMASAGSQGSQPHPGVSHHHYTFGGHSHGSWPTPGSSYGGPNSPTQTRQQPGAPQQFEPRPQSLFSQAPNAPYMNHRNSHSPATGGEGLPAPYEQPSLQHFQSHLGSGASGHPVSQAPASAPMNGAHAVDPYSHTRPPSGPNYSITAPPASQYPLPSPTQQSPSSTLPHRGLGGGIGGGFGPGQPAMASPNPYRQGYPYQPVHGLSGGMIPGMQPPSGQLAMVPGHVGMGHHPMSQHYVYAQQPASQPVDRPFKCDQCIQSFSRNHDLKRHKRIHLAVKPFPCGQCNKQFSRKDALKVR